MKPNWAVTSYKASGWQLEGAKRLGLIVKVLNALSKRYELDIIKA